MLAVSEPLRPARMAHDVPRQEESPEDEGLALENLMLGLLAGLWLAALLVLAACLIRLIYDLPLVLPILPPSGGS